MKNKLRNFTNISNIHNSDIDYVSIIFLCLEKLEYKMFQYAALHAIQKKSFYVGKKYSSSKGLEQYYGLMVDHKHS